MQFYSLNRQSPNANFKEAVIRGIAPDKGLYFPSEIKPIDKEIIENIDAYSYVELAYALIRQFVGDEIPEVELKNIIRDTLSFEFPLVAIEKDVYSSGIVPWPYHGL